MLVALALPSMTEWRRLSSASSPSSPMLADAGLSPADGAADERILSVLRNRDDIVAELKNVRHRAASQLDRHAVITSLAIALVDRIDAAVD